MEWEKGEFLLLLLLLNWTCSLAMYMGVKADAGRQSGQGDEQWVMGKESGQRNHHGPEQRGTGI